MGLNGEGVERGPRRPSAHIGNLEIPPYRATDRRSSHLELNARRDDAGAMITIAAWGTTGPGELPRFGSNPRALDWGTAASNACIGRALAPQRESPTEASGARAQRMSARRASSGTADDVCGTGDMLPCGERPVDVGVGYSGTPKIGKARVCAMSMCQLPGPLSRNPGARSDDLAESDNEAAWTR